MHAPEYCGLLWELPLVGASFKILLLCHFVLHISLTASPRHNICGIHVLLSNGLNELLPETNMMCVIT